MGQVLDTKYQMSRELGRGGMGAVYLATHLGTERPVAVKVIAPQFMERVEFVERFRREARAAGRLRHPNVVNVTDFGFAHTKKGEVAYLVMEYLDGCTLGEILDEEKNLPVGWTLDILEQVCSAVQEAHEQGIIHRDLKPDNIWLEPNQRGGYTVKVLDFGIAKLEEQDAQAGEGIREPESAVLNGKATIAGRLSTQASEGDTVAIGVAVTPPGIDREAETAIFTGRTPSDDQETIGTRAMSGDISDDATGGRSLYDSGSSGELTRVGAVLGTPLYMSPEQCRGEHLDARSDIYSLGVIAYQMLSGEPPFRGDFAEVMEAHKTREPRQLVARHARRKMRRAIHCALSKDPQKRPQTAEAFASELRARSEGIFGLLRRAMVIYSEHLAKFLLLTGFFSLPMILLTVSLLIVSFLRVGGAISDGTGSAALGTVGFLLSIASAFCTALITGTIAWIVTQYLSVPLRPLRLRPALKEARKKWKRMAGASFLAAVLPFVVAAVAGIVGFILLFLVGLLLVPFTGSYEVAAIIGAGGAAVLGLLGFFAAYISWILVPPIVMMENLRVIEALRRSRRLVKRSFVTAFAAVCIIFLIPFVVAGSISMIVNVTAKAYGVTIHDQEERPAEPASAADAENVEKSAPNINFSFGKSGARLLSTSGKEMDMQTRLKQTAFESLIQILWLPMQIFVFSFSGIIVALLYLKTRLAGGESMSDLVERFADDGRPKKKWQERVRQRLIQSRRTPSNP
jgi:serine/threonine protein kinase